jgi:hypothetical protein
MEIDGRRFERIIGYKIDRETGGHATVTVSFRAAIVPLKEVPK